MSADLPSTLQAYFGSTPGIVALFLFGSHAKNRSQASSDVDIAVLYQPEYIPEFRAVLDLKQDLSRLLNSEVDVVVLNRANPILKHQVFRDGQMILEINPKMRKHFMIKSLGEYDDLKRIRAPIEKSILKGRVYGG